MTAPALRTVMTAAVAGWVGVDRERMVWLGECLARHCVGDWGDIDHDDWAVNDRAVHLRCGRVLSSYRVPTQLGEMNRDSQIWVITDDLEDPDTATTVLFPSDY